MSNRLPTHPFSKTQLLTSPVELLTYEVDAGFDRGKPDGVFLPESTADVVKLVNLMREHQVPLIARGAGTGLSGGAVAEHGGVIVNFARMNRVLAFDPAGRSAAGAVDPSRHGGNRPRRRLGHGRRNRSAWHGHDDPNDTQ